MSGLFTLISKGVRQPQKITLYCMKRLATLQKSFQREPKWPARPARAWSNAELLKFAKLYHGDIINVSAWRDEDKEEGHYRDYFVNASSYSISNYDGWRGISSAEEISDYRIDLEQPLLSDLVRSFDVVFNHTTLEHIFKVVDAFHNLCTLSRDTVILVAPFVQHLHGPENGDFWRFSPYCIRALFRENGLAVLYESANVGLGHEVIYLFYIASRCPERWLGMIPRCSVDASHLKRLRCKAVASKLE